MCISLFIYINAIHFYLHICISPLVEKENVAIKIKLTGKVDLPSHCVCFWFLKSFFPSLFSLFRLVLDVGFAMPATTAKYIYIGHTLLVQSITVPEDFQRARWLLWLPKGSVGLLPPDPPFLGIHVRTGVSRLRQVRGAHGPGLAWGKGYLPAGDDSDNVCQDASFQLVASFVPCPWANVQFIVSRLRLFCEMALMPEKGW